jgi:hypothetical protein
MATATLGYELAAGETLAAPAVWRRKDGYLLATAVFLEIVLAVTLIRLTHHFHGQWVEMLFSGALCGQVFLLGLWAALGGLNAAPRMVLVVLAWLAGSLAFQVASELPDTWQPGAFLLPTRLLDLTSKVLDNLFEVLIVGGILVSTFAALLLPLRRLAGWRIDFSPTYYRSIRGRRGQVGLMDFAALTCAVALPLSLVRLMAGTDGTDANEALLAPVLVVTIGLSAAPAAFAVMARRRVAWWLVAAAIWTVGVSWLNSLVAARLDAFDFFGGTESYWGLYAGAVLMHGAIASVIVLTLGGLRLCGLSLIAVGGQIK